MDSASDVSGTRVLEKASGATFHLLQVGGKIFPDIACQHRTIRHLYSACINPSAKGPQAPATAVLVSATRLMPATGSTQ